MSFDKLESMQSFKFRVNFITMKSLKKFKDIKATPFTGYQLEVLEGIKEAVEEVKLIKQGKLKGIPAKDLLNEL
jgi:hypothetical protein